MTLNLITSSTVKTQLGISGSTYDTAIQTMIPIVSADVRKILNYEFDCLESATFTASSASCTLPLEIPLGTVIDSPYVAADTYVLSYNPVTGYHTLSAAASSSGDYFYRSVNISQWPTISKMIWYKISKMTTTSAEQRGVSSESFGPVSISYSQAEIDNNYDYPIQLIKDLGAKYASVI